MSSTLSSTIGRQNPAPALKTGPWTSGNLDQLDRRTIRFDVHKANPITAVMRPENHSAPLHSRIQVFHLKGNMRRGLHQLRHRCPRLETQPLNTKLIGLEAGHMHFYIFHIFLARLGLGRRNPDMMKRIISLRHIGLLATSITPAAARYPAGRA